MFLHLSKKLTTHTCLPNRPKILSGQPRSQFAAALVQTVGADKHGFSYFIITIVQQADGIGNEEVNAPMQINRMSTQQHTVVR